MRFEPGQRYRMPVMFGPATGPRQGPDGERFSTAQSPKTVAAVTFKTDAEAIEALLPPGFTRLGDPVVTVELTRYRELEWLAGRGYSTLGVKTPARFQGRRDTATGPLLLVLWENMADPIITGREELGFAKLYCELPEDRRFRERIRYEARWDGHAFFELELSGLAAAEPPPAPAVDGLLHYRYLPKVGAPGEADVEYAAMTPFGRAAVTTEHYHTAQASLRFVPSTWEQLPTMHRVVNALADLPIRGIRAAWIAEQRGGTDLSEQQPLA